MPMVRRGRSPRRRGRPGRATSSLRGSWPIAMNSPPTSQVALGAGDGVAQPDAARRCRRRGCRRPRCSRPSGSSGSASARSTMIRLARRLSRRCTTVTELGEAGQERRLLHRGVAAADDRDVLVAEEEAVTGRAPGHAVAGQLVLAGEAELAVGRAHRQDHRVGGELAVVRAHDLDRSGQVDRDDVVGDQLGAEPLGLGADVGHQLRAHDARPGSRGSSRPRWCSSARRRTASPRTPAARGRRGRCRARRCSRPGRSRR